jgi:tetratricopeptide (TPR) repeat protein
VNAARIAAACGFAALLLVVGCTEPLPPLAPVPTPDTAGNEAAVNAAVAQAFAGVESARTAKPARAALAQAHGEQAMVCHAQQFSPCAQAAYGNARLLAPQDLRWPYLLGHLLADNGQHEPAARSFEAALALDGNHAPTLFSLGEVLLQRGEFERARGLFVKLQDRPDARAAALAGLGRVALANQDPRAAIGHYEEALRLWPAASRLHYPLAQAYRALGDEAKAGEALRSYSPAGVEPSLPDPLVDAMGAKVASSRALLRRGQRYAQALRFDLALPVFEAAQRANPQDGEILANLGIAQANLGRLDEALSALRASLARADTDAHVHFALATVLDRLGQDDAAASAYAAALRLDAKHAQALLYLADVQMRNARFDAAAQHYRQALQLAPSARTRLSLALALWRGGRERDARAELERGVAAEPTHLATGNALARLLAAAPDARVRDGRRALALSQRLLQSSSSPELGQTLAMALAETGDFSRAVDVQQQVIAAYRGSAPAAWLAALESNLARYGQRQAARQPWPDNDPIFQPRSPAVMRSP